MPFENRMTSLAAKFSVGTLEVEGEPGDEPDDEPPSLLSRDLPLSCLAGADMAVCSVVCRVVVVVFWLLLP